MRYTDCMANTWQESQGMREYTGAGGLLAAIKAGEELEDEEWAKLYDTATPYQRRCARLILDPTCAPHGSPSTYTNWGCRCDLCTLAYTESRSGAAVLRDFGDDPGEDPVPDDIARIKAMQDLGQPLTEKAQARLLAWEQQHAIDGVI